MSMQAVPLEDILADVLATARVGGVLTVEGELTAPWGIHFPRGPVAAFHVLLDGPCWLRTPKARAVALAPGEVVLMAGGGAHALASAATGPTTPFTALRCDEAVGVPVLRFGGRGAPSHLLCGVYRFERDAPHPVLGILPPVLRINTAGTPAAALLGLLRDEVARCRPGVRSALGLFVDLLFLFLVRAWVDSQPEGSGGWLGALRDPQIARALGLMHAAPEQRWTVDLLAAEAAMSRATFARRFQALVGVPPLGYLTDLRMRRAMRMLRDGGVPMTEVATRVGYESVHAFSRAFHRKHGLPPGRWRAGR